MRKKKKILLHQRIHHHLVKHFHRHIHKVLHFANCLHHNTLHGLELVVVCVVTLGMIHSLWFANLTGLNQELYTNNTTETADHLLNAMQNPAASLKQWNIISIWSMDMDVENTFTKGYCTYGAARVSPEFFPYTDTKTQQRTWWGNAVDRCKNASDTWYKIWSVPSQWALIIYNAGGRFWSYGHVGKVLHYDKKINKIIVRDMARVAKWTMSDRWEDLTTANVKCYIYNSKTNIPDIVPVEPIIPVANTWTTPIVPTVIQPTIPTITTPEVPAHPSAPVVVIPPQEPVVVLPPVISQDSINEKIVLTFDNLSDIAKHFISQHDLVITLVSKSPLKLGEVATLTLEIKNKNTGELFDGFLPFSFAILSTNDNVQSSISNIQMITNGVVDITVLGQKIGTASVVIHMDDTKIGEFSMEVK